MLSAANKIPLLHAHLGHAPLSNLHYLPFFDNISFNSVDKFHYSVCPMDRQSRKPFSLSFSRTDSPFHLLHIDLWGTYKESNHNGHHFFLQLLMTILE